MKLVDKYRNYQKGFTLIELMISISLGIVAVSAIMFFYISTITSSYSTLKSSRLNQEMSSLMSIMTNEIRRAGYNGTYNEDSSSNLFSNVSSKTVLMINDVTFDTSSTATNKGSCITFTYDRDLDGVIDTEEYGGFKLSSNEVYMRTSSGSCSTATWEKITDANEIKVTNLDFDFSDSICMNNSEPDKVDQDGSNGIDDFDEFNCYKLIPNTTSYPVINGETVITSEVWIVDISLDASLTDDTDVIISLVQKIQVRNPHISQVTP